MHQREWMKEALQSLCSLDSTTGQEDQLLPALVPMLREAGAAIELQTVAQSRSNIIATWGEPLVLSSTHIDTVPPFLPVHINGDVILGRGACDAKGQIVAQLACIRQLLSEGHTGLAWLGVVGEETDSIGAKRAALDLRGRWPRLRALLNGEPTQNRIATGQRGILLLRLVCTGRSAHSGTPEQGRSAAWPLLEWLMALRKLARPTDVELGPEIWNLGTLKAGRAHNVVPDHAEAEILARTLPGSDFEEAARRLAPESGSLEVLNQTPPDRFPEVAGHERAPVPFGSDAPRLRSLVPDRTVILVGPGSIELAHGPNERITLSELEEGATLLHTLSRRFLSES